MSPIHNHNRCFPLGRILLLKPTKEEPKHNDAKTLSLFLYVLQLVSCRPKPRFIFISRKIRTKTERASYQAIDRPSDRSIERFSDFFFQTVFSSGNTFWPPLQLPDAASERLSDRTSYLIQVLGWAAPRTTALTQSRRSDSQRNPPTGLRAVQQGHFRGYNANVAPRIA